MSKQNLQIQANLHLPYKSIVDLMMDSFDKYKNLVAYQNMGAKIKFGQVDKLSRDFAAYLINVLNMEKGDRIGIQMPNLIQYPIVMLGALRAGLTVVNINPLYTPNEISHQIKDAGVKAIVILENFADKLEESLQETNMDCHVIITKVGDMLGTFKGFFVNKILKHIKGLVPNYRIPKKIYFKNVLKIGKKLPFISLNIESSDIAFLQYTGGTTGIAKGAILTHKNILSNIEQISEWAKHTIEEKKETVIAPLPMYHIFCLTNILLTLKLGAKCILITNPRAVKKFIKELKKHPFTILSGVNTLFNALIKNKEFLKVDFSHCKIVLGAGASIQENVAKEWESITGTPLIEAYGLTEASPGVVFNPSDGKHIMNSIGLPLPNTSIKIIDENENEVLPGQPGELLVKGPQVMSGYWNNQSETDKVLKDGWLKTGDIAIKGEDGYYRIVDRKKEMINVSGFNVYPNEIENIATLHPQILEAGVVGVPDTKTGEAVKAYIVPKDTLLTKNEVIAHFRKYLTGYKIPRFIEFRTKELPKSPVGKILRRVLKDEELACIKNLTPVS